MKKIAEKWYNDEYLQSVSNYIDLIMLGRAVICDIDLSGITIGPFAVVEKLRNTNLFESKINNSNLSFSKISGSISNSYLSHVNFQRSYLDGCSLFETKIKNCNFNKSKLVVNMDDAECEESCFVEAKFIGSSYGLEYGGRRVKFINCDFTGTIFDKVEFRASRFVNCIFTDTKFKRCDFRGVKFEGDILPSASQFENMDIPIQLV